MAKATKVPALRRATPLSVAGPLLCRARLADVRRYEPALRGGREPEPEVVHDMRVAIRRLRVALTLLGGRRLRALERQVEALQDALGALRDVQVHRDWLRARTVPGAAELARRLDRERPAAQGELEEVLRAWSTAVAPALERAIPSAARSGRLGSARVGREVRRAVGRLERRLEGEGLTRPRRAHAARIAGRRLRYLVELAAPAHRKASRRLLDELGPLADELGELHDTDVRIVRLRALARAGRARRAAASLLHGVVPVRAQLAGAVLRRVERWRSAGFLRAARRGFRRR